MKDTDFYRRIAQAHGIDAELQREAMHRLRLAWQASGTFTADQATTPALAIAWLVLAGHQLRMPCPPVAEMFPDCRRPDRALVEALGRAAMHVDEPLASHLRAIGVRHGRPIVKRPHQVVGTLRIALKMES